MKSLNDLKQHLKAEATAIRSLKASRKSHPNGLVPGLNFKRYDYRLKHLAYCLFRGRTLEQCESNRLVHPPSTWDWQRIVEEKSFQIDLERTIAELRLKLEASP